MKRNLFLICLCATQILMAQSKGIRVTPEKAIVYLNGAQLYYNQSINFREGTQEFIFEGVAAGLDPMSINTSGKGNFTILESRFHVVYPDQDALQKIPGKYAGKIKALKDSLEEVGYLLTALHDKKLVLESEKILLSGHRIIKGETRKDSLSLLRDAMQYYRDRMYNINAELLKTAKENTSIQRNKERMSLRLAEVQRLENEVGGNQGEQVLKPMHQVIVTIHAETAGAGSMQFDYYVQGAFWEPIYDVKANAGEGKVNIQMNANITQNTGLDWKQIKLTLSTGNPGIGQTKPVIGSYVLDFLRPMYESKRLRTDAGDIPQSMTAETLDKTMLTGNSNFNPVAVNEGANNVEYDIQTPANIASDNKPHLVNIRQNQLAAEYRYFGIPLSDQDAFLTARITQWEDLNLLPGNARLYVDGSYGGTAYINPQETEDTLSLDLGRDKSIVVKRKKFSKTRKTLTGSKIVTVTCDILVRNTKNGPIVFDLFDRVPLSSNKEIEVKTLEKSSGNLEESTGIINWKLNIKPKETASIKLVYEVKYPSGKNIPTP